jgi:hypothetical protein
LKCKRICKFIPRLHTVIATLAALSHLPHTVANTSYNAALRPGGRNSKTKHYTNENLMYNKSLQNYSYKAAINSRKMVENLGSASFAACSTSS